MKSVFDQSSDPPTNSVRPSTCWECGTICGSLLTVENGKVAKIAPNPAHAGSKGAFCVKGIRGAKEWTYSDGRLKTPLRRTKARGAATFEPISWEDAISEMADRFSDVRRRYGPASITGVTNGAFFSRGLMMALLMRSIGSPNWMINQDLCGGCRAVADKMTGLNVTGGEDIDETRCALIVGRNPSVADPVQWMALKRAKARGARVIVIDPFRTPAADLADVWLRPRPGTDAAIGLAMAHILIAEDLYDHSFTEQWCFGFDRFARHVSQFTPAWAEARSGVPAKDIIAAARIYAKGPSCFVSGHGIDAQALAFKPSVLSLPWSPLQATSIASAATDAQRNLMDSKQTSMSYSIRITGFHRKSRSNGLASKSFHFGLGLAGSRWRATILQSLMLF